MLERCALKLMKYSISTLPLSFSDLFFFFNISHQEWLKSHLCHEACVDPYSEMFQVSFEHVLMPLSVLNILLNGESKAK